MHRVQRLAHDEQQPAGQPPAAQLRLRRRRPKQSVPAGSGQSIPHDALNIPATCIPQPGRPARGLGRPAGQWLQWRRRLLHEPLPAGTVPRAAGQPAGARQPALRPECQWPRPTTLAPTPLGRRSLWKPVRPTRLAQPRTPPHRRQQRRLRLWKPGRQLRAPPGPLAVRRRGTPTKPHKVLGERRQAGHGLQESDQHLLQGQRTAGTRPESKVKPPHHSLPDTTNLLAELSNSTPS